MRQCVDGELQGRPQRRRIAVTDVVLAIAADRHVGGDHQVLITGGAHAIEQRTDLVAVGRQIGLEPSGRIRGRDALERDDRRAAQQERNIRGGGSARISDIRVETGEPRRTHRGDPERGVVAVAEQLTCCRARRRIDQHVRHERPAGKRAAVGAQRPVGLHAAGDIAKHAARQESARSRLEIIERQDRLEPARAARWRGRLSDGRVRHCRHARLSFRDGHRARMTILARTCKS
jgi:hypothetical protein